MCMLQGSWGEAAKKLAEVVDDDTFRSLEGKSKHQLWLELCDIITRHPELVRGMKVDAILRSGIRKFTDEVSAAEKEGASGGGGVREGGVRQGGCGGGICMSTGSRCPVLDPPFTSVMCWVAWGNWGGLRGLVR